MLKTDDFLSDFLSKFIEGGKKKRILHVYGKEINKFGEKKKIDYFFKLDFIYIYFLTS